MLKGFNLAKILNGNVAAGVEVVVNEKGAHEFNLTILEDANSKLEILNAGRSYTELDTLKEELGGDTPVNLVINGKGLIHKMVGAEQDDTDLSLIQKVMPNARLEDFYFDKEYSNDGRDRKSVV